MLNMQKLEILMGCSFKTLRGVAYIYNLTRDKTFKVRGMSFVIIITSYWYYNLILLPKSSDDFATDVLLMIDGCRAHFIIIGLER